MVDALSVQTGCGPECRKRHLEKDAGIDQDVRKIANEHVYRAAMASQKGEVEKVLEYAELIRKLGLDVLADKVGRRFRDAIVKAERSSDIVVEERDGGYRVVTPFRRGSKDAFVAAWRGIPGRRWRDGANWVPAESKSQLWQVLREFFPGRYGRGPKGVFRIPAADFKSKQGELQMAG